MRVLINGLGNIGTTLAQLLLSYQSELGITEIIGCKRTLNQWNENDFSSLTKAGMKLISYADSFDSISKEVDYIFETTANGVGLDHKNYYEQLSNLKGCSAQGSEKGFGISFMSGINDSVIINEKFVHVVSCNTHGSAALLKTISGNDLSKVDSADFVVVRRSEDLGQHERLVTANVVARHLDPKIGTHHCIDVVDLLKTIDTAINLTSSDITTPSQLLHSVRFNIKLKESISATELTARIAADSFVSTTNKFDSNLVFEHGRRYGQAGRLYSHAILVDNNLLVNDISVKGWAFVPQEGNTLISTIHAFLLQTGQDDTMIEKLKTELIIQSI